MSQISVSNLTFCYEGSFDNIFENVSFLIDTDWKLGLIGRNGKGKTTFLNLLLGNYEYEGNISSSVVFDYFPYRITEEQAGQCGAEFLEQIKQGCELWRVICELDKLHLDAEILYRPFGTLSHGERTKVMLAVLFSGENDFLLIDEPTNHLDRESRETVKEYLRQKKGFILVSHDRDLLDACIDHVLVLNRCSIEVQSGNFSSWWENKSRMDAFHQMENEKHKKEIRRLHQAADRTREWADKNESTKIGFNPVKEHDRSIATRAYIGAKTKKMQSRRMQVEKRIMDEIEQKEGLLQDIENPAELKLMPMQHHKEVLITAKEYGIAYGSCEVFHGLDFELRRGERVFLHGENGCGKSSLIRAVLAHSGMTCRPVDSVHGRDSHSMPAPDEYGGSPSNTVLPVDDRTYGSQRQNDVWRLDGTGTEVSDIMLEKGTLKCASGLTISYINQDTAGLGGTIKEFCRKNDLDESLFCAILRQLDLERVQFVKRIEDYSEGQKKKVLIAASLLKPAHLYIWDEPLNYIDVFSRMQIENLILTYQPTMLIVEHDVRFREKIATKVVEL